MAVNTVADIGHLTHWVPARAYWASNQFMVDWCYMGAARFTRPFFDDDLTLRMRFRFSALFQHHTPIELLGELAEAQPGVRPAGFIFHTSRCGSTLASQMLAALPQNIVISEASPIDKVLRSGAGEADRIQWLRWIISALGRKRFTEEEHYFVKFDSWNVRDLSVVRKAFPDTPWVFMYRNPIEIIVSQMRQRGAHMIPGAIDLKLPGLSDDQIFQIPVEEYCARVLANSCEAALEFRDDPKALFINYYELPDAFFAKILPHFGVSYASEDIEKMREVSKYNAKNRANEFDPDSKRKRENASDAVRAAASQWVDHLYHELEAIRLAKRLKI